MDLYSIAVGILAGLCGFFFLLRLLRLLALCVVGPEFGPQTLSTEQTRSVIYMQGAATATTLLFTIPSIGAVILTRLGTVPMSDAMARALFTCFLAATAFFYAWLLVRDWSLRSPVHETVQWARMGTWILLVLQMLVITALAALEFTTRYNQMMHPTPLIFVWGGLDLCLFTMGTRLYWRTYRARIRIREQLRQLDESFHERISLGGARGGTQNISDVVTSIITRTAVAMGVYIIGFIVHWILFGLTVMKCTDKSTALCVMKPGTDAMGLMIWAVAAEFGICISHRDDIATMSLFACCACTCKQTASDNGQGPHNRARLSDILGQSVHNMSQNPELLLKYSITDNSELALPHLNGEQEPETSHRGTGQDITEI